MNQFFKTTIGFALCSFIGTTIFAQDQDTTEPPPKIDPVALEIIEAAANYLTAQQTLEVSWFVSYDEVVDGREKITALRSGYNLLDRDRGFVAETVDGLDTRRYYFDGGAFSVYDVEADAFAQIPFFGDYERLIERIRDEYDLVLPIWSVLSRGHKRQFVESAEHIAYLGRTRLAGDIVHHIALSNYDSDWQVWISDDATAPLIRMIVGTDPYEQGWPQFRAYFNNWDMAPEIEDGSFSFVPDETTERMTWPRSVGAIGNGGQ